MTGVATYSWNAVAHGSMGIESANANMMGGGLIGLALSFVIAFKPHMAAVLAMLFAICEGLMLGAISAVYQYAVYPDIVLHAVLLTVGVSLSMFLSWRFGIIEAHCGRDHLRGCGWPRAGNDPARLRLGAGGIAGPELRLCDR
ncbi:MAG: hypothetical protein GY930_06715 [bacterium]|nr:hypothetical protein [bacterium]